MSPIGDGITNCDVIKLWKELALIQPELALGCSGLELQSIGRFDRTPTDTTAQEDFVF